VHRDPRYFLPDPDAFWPERWLHDEGAKIAEARGQPFRLDQAAYMPFNFGPCIDLLPSTSLCLQTFCRPGELHRALARAARAAHYPVSRRPPLRRALRTGLHCGRLDPPAQGLVHSRTRNAQCRAHQTGLRLSVLMMMRSIVRGYNVIIISTDLETLFEELQLCRHNRDVLSGNLKTNSVQHI
jgi:hypothetical protein